MADIIDRANELAEQHTAYALRQHRSRAALACIEAAEICQACDEPIPQARRQAVPGCQLCVACQQRSEQEMRA